eukprot:scaffold1016_cov105-Cylindrotheca_fusiformis.AAC.5
MVQNFLWTLQRVLDTLLEIDDQGVAYSWGKSNSLGQLGRKESSSKSSTSSSSSSPGPIEGLPPERKIRKAFVSQGSDSSSGTFRSNR